MILYSIKDCVAQTFATPFPAINDAVAVRMCVDLVRTPGNGVNAHPNDYQLWFMTEFNEITGECVGAPKLVQNLGGLVEMKGESEDG